MQPRSSAPEPICLAKGQSFHFHACTGTRIIVMRGSIDVVDRSVWLCKRFVEQRCTMRDGEQHMIPQRGWIALQAREAAEFFCVEPKAKGSVIGTLRAWQRMVADRLRFA